MHLLLLFYLLADKLFLVVIDVLGREELFVGLFFLVAFFEHTEDFLREFGHLTLSQEA